MKRWKKLAFLLLVLALLSQLPFAYRRTKLARLHSAIQQLNSQRVTQDDPSFSEYKGVSHVHSFLGEHSSGTFQGIIAAARANRLDFVAMTEHTEQHINTAALTLKGTFDGVLFINGNEVDTDGTDRVLLIPGPESTGDDSNSPSLETILKQGRGKQGLTIVAYPQQFRGWDTNPYDGVEVYNLYTNAREINPFVMFFDALWSYRTYPDLLFASFYARPAENLRLWDQSVGRGRRVVGLAGNDAHANVGFSLRDGSGKTVLGLQLDPYERSFQLVRIHVLIPRGQMLNSETLLTALGEGHCFVGFDIFSDTTGFRFTATSGTETKIQGDELTLQGDARLSVTTPLVSRIVLLRDGKAIKESAGVARQDFVITERGVYRVEIFLPQLPHSVRDQPWIISNPIYLR